MSVRIIIGDVRAKMAELPDESVNCVVTSPPYFGLRDYGIAGQIGLEETPNAYVAELVAVFNEARRVLRDDGTLWLNLGDSYAGSWGARGRGEHTNAPRPDLVAKYGTAAPARKVFRPGNPSKNKGNSNRDGLGPVAGCKAKDLIGVPWRVAFALQADGWWLRSDIIWHKPNPMPESITDRPTSAHEHIFLLAKSDRYYFDRDAVAEQSAYAGDQAGICRGTKRRAEAMGRAPSGNEKPGANWIQPETRNIRNVWTVTTEPFPGAHFATFPPSLIEPCIKAGCPIGGTVLDPFGGAGTTGLVADRLGRNATLIELNPEYAEMARRRIQGDAPMFAEVTAA